jgi:hypothetical protein
MRAIKEIKSSTVKIMFLAHTHATTSWIHKGQFFFVLLYFPPPSRYFLFPVLPQPTHFHEARE